MTVTKLALQMLNFPRWQFALRRITTKLELANCFYHLPTRQRASIQLITSGHKHHSSCKRTSTQRHVHVFCSSGRSVLGSRELKEPHN